MARRTASGTGGGGEKKRDPRMPISLHFLLRVKLAITARSHGIGRTAMAERIIDDALGSSMRWAETQLAILQEASLRGIDPAELLREILEAEGFGDEIDFDQADLSLLLLSHPPFDPDGDRSID